MKAKRIVLVHGWGARAKKLQKLQDQLTRRGWKVYTIKLPGFDIEAPNNVWGVPEYANYVLKNSKKFFKSNHFVVLGHSNGGRIAIELAAKSKIDAVVLVSSAGISRPLSLKRYFFFTLSKVGRPIKDTAVGPLLRKVLYKAAREHDYEKTEDIMKKVFQKIIKYKQKDDIEKVKVPVLVLWGKKDKTTPYKDAKYIERHARKANLVTFDDATHALPYQKPKPIAEEVDSWYKQI